MTFALDDIHPALYELIRPFMPTHRHRKGGLYQLLGYGRHTETEEELAFYRSADGRLWARPRAMFDEPGRFAPIDGRDPSRDEAAREPRGATSR